MYSRRFNKASSRIAQRGKARKNLGLFLRALLAALVLVCIVTLFRADFLQVDAFVVQGGQFVGEENIQNAAAKFSAGSNLAVLPRSNILFLQKDKLAGALLSQFGRLQTVKVDKNFFSQTVRISVTEREGDFFWCSKNEECFFMNKDGLVFEKISEAAKATSDKIIFRGKLEGNPLMKNFATPEEMVNFLKLTQSLENAGFEVASIYIESSDKAVAETDRGDIIFTPDEPDLSLVAQNVILLISEIKSKIPSADFEYIDARFGNKIFYKLY